MRIVVLALIGVLATHAAAAQQFQPPKNGGHGGTRIGLFGFGVRGGVDVRRSGQLVLGSTLDIGVFNGPNTYVGNFELLWRFTNDEEVATPYIGAGLGLAGRDGCGADPGCPGLWLNTAFGFELRYRSTFNWVLEYHGMDRLRRHRFFIGLTTRRGN